MKKGFTIVELLIVIVVIGILAAITLVAYSGIQDRARTASLQSDLQSAMKSLESIKIQDSGERYPSSLSSTNIPVANTSYYYNPSDNSYCLSKINGTKIYHVSSFNNIPTEGLCGQSDLTGWWKLNNNASDSTLSNNGSLVNVTSVPGQNGITNGAYAFNGTDSEINIPIPSTSITNVTISAWIYMQSTTKGTVFHMGDNSGGYSLGVGDGFNSQNRRMVGLFPGRRWILTTTYISDGWHQIGMTLSQDSTPSFYYDGEVVGGSYSGTAPNVPTTLMVLGRNTGDEGSSATNRLFNSSIDDVRFYSRVLTGGEFKGLYTAGAQ